MQDQLEKVFDRRIPFLSDPEFKLIEAVDMRNDDVAYRGYAIIDSEGKVILKKKNDYWGRQFDQTVEDIKEVLKK